ncbi:MAG: shikimate kinase [Methanomassiliicoccales archaeon]|jgi:shikimate kinase|nr:shikimate kinase [Methanomassiliicoccales archaeon]
MRGRGTSHGAGTIVNAIATGRGAAFGLDLLTEAEVELDSSGEIKVIIEGFEGEPTALAERCVLNVLNKEAPREGYGATVTTRSQIPISRGLKSSSAAANAIVLATYQALDKEVEPLRAVRVGTKSAIEAKVSVTGAFDDACASLLGGVVLTDNRRESIVRRASLPPGLAAVVHVPSFQVRKQGLPLERIRAVAPAAEAAFERARKGHYKEAMLINSLAYASALGQGLDAMYGALGAGAYAAGLSGTGPATVVLCAQENLSAIKALFDPAEVITANIYDPEGEK